MFKAAVDNGQTSTGDWWTEWVFVNNIGKYANKKTLQVLSIAAFNIKMGQFIEGKRKPSAHKFITDNSLVDIVEYIIYDPRKPVIFERNNSLFINLFNKDSIPKEAKSITKGGSKVIEKVKSHILMLCNQDSEKYDILMSWIAHNVRYPGRKIPWCPLIYSIQGIGKGFITELLRAILGKENITTVPACQVASNFNSWAEKSLVNVLNELKFPRSQRSLAANSLKEKITDPRIMINAKGISPYTIDNITNYMIQTNEEDSIPITESDRRFFVIYNNLHHISELERYFEMDESDYFDELFETLKYADELRLFFLNHKIKIKNINKAPMTSDKKYMIQNEISMIEGLPEAEQIINNSTSAVVNKDFLICPDFWNIASFHHEFRSNIQKSKILKGLGYFQHKKNYNSKGGKKRIWVKDINFIEVAEDVIKNQEKEKIL